MNNNTTKILKIEKGKKYRCIRSVYSEGLICHKENNIYESFEEGCLCDENSVSTGGYNDHPLRSMFVEANESENLPKDKDHNSITYGVQFTVSALMQDIQTIEGESILYWNKVEEYLLKINQ